MNWSEVEAISNLVATAAVVATLGYLALQIRHATRESRLSAIHDLSASYTSWIQSIAASSDLSRIWDCGLIDYEALKQEETVRFLLMMGSFMRILDDAYCQFVSGRMGQSDWEIYESLLDLGAGSSGTSAYFLLRKKVHTPEFSSLLAEKISSAKPNDESLYK